MNELSANRVLVRRTTKFPRVDDRSLGDAVTFTAIVPRAYPGEAKMCLRLIAETDAYAFRWR